MTGIISMGRGVPKTDNRQSALVAVTLEAYKIVPCTIVNAPLARTYRREGHI